MQPIKVLNLVTFVVVTVFLCGQATEYVESKNTSNTIVEPSVRVNTVVETAQASPTVSKVETVEEMIVRYFPEEPKKALAIARCESGTDSSKENLVGRDNSYGIFQINIIGKLAKVRPTADELKDPETNIKTARSIYVGAGYTFSKDWVICSRLYAQGKLK